MLCWAFNAIFTKASRRTTTETSFNDIPDMPGERPPKEMKSVTHVYIHCVTHVHALCREGERFLDRETFFVARASLFSIKNRSSIPSPGGEGEPSSPGMLSQFANS
jgi:hypothetical protein